jgi:hypothetical protein
MTVQDLIDSLTDYGFTDTSTIRKMSKINETIWDITTREAWPFMEASVDLIFDGIHTYPTNSQPSEGLSPAESLPPGLPTDVLSVLDITRTVDGVKLQPIRLQEADATMALQLTQTGTPRFYYFIATALHVANIPAATDVLRLRYIRKHPQLVQTDVESAILIPREHHELVELGTLVKLYDMEDDTELSVRFQQLYEKKLQDMRQSVWMRQYDRPDHIVITDQAYDDFYS